MAGAGRGPPPTGRRRGRGPGAGVGLLVLLVLVPLPGVAVPSRVAAFPGASVHIAWAYAGTFEHGGTSLVGQVAVGYSDSANYAVVLNQTLSNGSLVELSISRLISTRSYLIACYPNCTDPLAAMTASGVGIEFDTAELELTQEAQVVVNGTVKPALGLQAEQLTLAGNLTVRFSWENFSGPGRPTAEWFNGTTVANTTGEFDASTPLGLLPAALASGQAWNGTGVFAADARTAFSGHTRYQGNLVPANGSEFNGTSVPISPLTVTVNASDAGTPTNRSLAGDAAVAFAPPSGGTSLVEGAVMVPTSAYIAAAFSSGCDAAQRACIGVGATPELDFNASATDHLGWDGAVSAVTAFSLFLGPSAVTDTPDGLPFWPAAAGVTPGAEPASASVPATITGSPVPVPIALSIQHSFYPPPGPNGSSVPPASSHAPADRVPPTLGGRGTGGTAAPAPPLPAAVEGAGTIPLGALLAGVVLVAAVGVGASALATRRRRPPRRRDPELVEASPADPPPEGGEPPEDPMGYVW
ncbi:MAG TPA: hypothetical protein VMH90_06995 [Thermoplasmata archaeon]|nr:hypothetical protein [Thermoplasmata archaeon]